MGLPKELMVIGLLGLTLLLGSSHTTAADSRIRIILDSDANNELDDQHVIAYLLMSGGDIQGHVTEAARVAALAGLTSSVPIYR